MTEANVPSTRLTVNVLGDQVGAGLGKAQRMAVAAVVGDQITAWDEYDVRWDLSHGQGGEGRHHATIVRFMREHAVQAVVTGHMGPPMVNTMTKLGVTPIVNATGSARDAAIAAARLLEDGGR